MWSNLSLRWRNILDVELALCVSSIDDGGVGAHTLASGTKTKR